MSDFEDVTLYIEFMVGLAASAALESASAAVVATEVAAEAEKLAVAETAEAVYAVLLAALREVGFVLDVVVVMMYK
jgi:hypothetical protein